MQILTNQTAVNFCNTVLTKQLNNTKSFTILVAFVLSQRLTLPPDGDHETHYLDVRKSIVEPALEGFIRVLPCSAMEILDATEALYKWRVAVATGSLMVRKVEDLSSLTGAGNYIPNRFKDILKVENKDILPGQLIWGIDKVLEELMPAIQGV